MRWLKGATELWRKHTTRNKLRRQFWERERNIFILVDFQVLGSVYAVQLLYFLNHELTWVSIIYLPTFSLEIIVVLFFSNQTSTKASFVFLYSHFFLPQSTVCSLSLKWMKTITYIFVIQGWVSDHGRAFSTLPLGFGNHC